MAKIYLVEELWTDPKAKDQTLAYGYAVIAATLKRGIAEKLVMDGGMYNGKGRPLIAAGTPMRRIKELDLVE